jgi:hypothetical protein
VPDGSNWEIMCEPCNAGKADVLSYHQIPASLNWVYSSNSIKEPLWHLSILHKQTRYVTLMRFQRCYHDDCQAGPSDAYLRVISRDGDGLLIPDHLIVECDRH